MNIREIIGDPNEYYRKLQGSRLRPESFEAWESYRRNVTDMILECCRPDSSLALFGAGQCNDIDLARLAEHFRHIELLDINIETLRKGLVRYGLDSENSFDCEIDSKVLDFAGISESDYVEFIRAMCDSWSDGPNTDFMISTLDKIYGRRKRLKEAGTYDYSVVFGVHSQLNDTMDWLYTDMCRKVAYKLPNDPAFDSVRRRISQETGIIVREFNDAFIRSGRMGTINASESGIAGNALNIQGAYHNLLDIAEREKNGTITIKKVCHMEWPQNKEKGIIFDMLAMHTVNNT